MPKLKPWSDIDLQKWKEYPDIKTDSLWIYQNRSKRHGHTLDYHGNFIPQIANQLFHRYTKQNDIVLDMFIGSGTSAIEAIHMKRRCIGIDLNNDMVNKVKQKISELTNNNNDIDIIHGDSANPDIANIINSRILPQMKSDYVQFLILHPPYADIIKFSDNEQDLSNCSNTKEFLDQFQNVAQNGYDLLEPGRFAALIIGDKYAKGELIPLGFLCMERMNRVGFKTKAIVVKNIEGNESGKGKNANLWRYRALAGGYYVFKHEYVILFQKKKLKGKKVKK